MWANKPLECVAERMIARACVKRPVPLTRATPRNVVVVAGRQREGGKILRSY